MICNPPHPILWVVLSTFLMVSLEAQTFLILMKYNLFLFYVAIISKKALPNQWLQRFNPIFSSLSFIVLLLTFGAMIHFELFFCMCVYEEAV